MTTEIEITESVCEHDFSAAHLDVVASPFLTEWRPYCRKCGVYQYDNYGADI